MSEFVDVLILNDEDGNEITFELIATLDIGDKTYLVTAPFNEETYNPDEEVDAYVFVMGIDDDGDDCMFQVEDDETILMVQEAYEQASKNSLN